ERTQMKVVHEQTPKLFAPGKCPNTALYCGWYSLKKYVDAFDFVTGAVGYHIASWEALDLRDPRSTQWCPAMLRDGITATMGAVAEPYLATFPKPDLFFAQLVNGKCLAEAFYRTKPYNSWQMVLIGDPLYTPFD
ncbi:MAG: TIGR03790 family protein, partial [Planctomycetota bacterium]